MIRKPKAIKESKTQYVASSKRADDDSTGRFALRNATPAQRKLLRRDVSLYDKHAKHLESEHKGEYVAIGLDGTLVVSTKHVEVLCQAAEKFGAGNFALWKIGYNYVLKWRRL
ncbi:MAG: hypothetical protein HY327_09165 [Chloroflexi bacterium]|nr:hypothetical protein [Chloroflexota bacterium]